MDGHATRTLHLGIDVGASGFRLALSDERGPVRDLIASSDARRTVGPAGLAMTAVVAAIGRTLPELLAQVPGGRIASVGVGLAGGATHADSLRDLPGELARLTGAATVVCCSDTVVAYLGAFGVEAGAVLAAGTGAVAVGTDGHTQWRLVDGQGYLLGDAGGGAWIGRQGLELALRHDAGRRNGSAALAAALIREHGSARALIRHVHTTTEPSAALASFAPHVFAAAADGDPPARAVVDEAADLLAETLIDASEGITDRVAVVGGLVPGSALLHERLLARLRDAGRQPVQSPGTPAGGAAELARLTDQGALPAVFADRVVARTPID